MKKDLVVVKIEAEDMIKLEKLHYEVNALADLINRMMLNVVTPDNFESALHKYMDEYTKKFKEYEDFKDYISQKYSPENGITWTADFNDGSIIVEVEA